MDPLLLQQQLVNNNQEYVDIFNDLKSWGKEMEKKDQERLPQKQESQSKKFVSQEVKKQKVDEINRAKKEALDDKKVLKKKCVTYADWDKFDADKECEKIDEDSDSNSDSLVDDLKDQALIEKDLGNKYVKVGKWNEAIKSYTNAIRYYAYDPIFYANRALCFLKTKQMEKAEQDCNVSLKLDNTYVKAYQRRAAARESLNKLEEAKSDLLRVLELEPKNTESKIKLEEITKKIKTLGPQKPVSMFSKSRQHFKRPSQDTLNHTISNENYEKSSNENIDTNVPECIWPTGVVTNIIKAVQKPPHMRSEKPLRRIAIQEINSAIPESSQTLNMNDISNSAKNNANINISKQNFHTEDVKIMEHKNTVCTSKVETMSKEENILDVNIPKLTTPKTSVQFHLIWKQLKGHNDKRIEYLRLINPQNIPYLFKDSLESDVFSEILLILAENLTKDTNTTYDFLLNLSKIKRFSALTMFLTLSDKNSLWKMFNHMKEFEGRSKEEIDNLIVKYEL